jgi:hypothetical protein
VIDDAGGQVLLHVLTGAASPAQLKALIVYQGAAATPQLQAASSGGEVRYQVTAAQVSAQLAAAMAARSLQVWNVFLTIDGAQGGDHDLELQVTVGGESRSVRVRTLPNALGPDGLAIIVASCFYGGFKRDAALRAALASPYLGQRTAFQLWVGDNLYLDVPTFNSDVLPYQQTLDRYLKYFLDSDYPLARNLQPNFTIFDDHEFWNDYPVPQLWLSRTQSSEIASYAQAARECLQLFQASLNPQPAVRSGDHGYSYQFTIPPLSFFVADTRCRRTLSGPGGPRLMHPNDLQALKDWAQNLNGPGVLVLGQPLWIEGIDELPLVIADHNPPFFAQDFRAIWSALRETLYDVLVISGDVHYSRLLKISFANAPLRSVFEFVSSPACHVPDFASSIGWGNSQARSPVDAPAQLASSGQNLKAQYFFGTSAANSFGVLSFRNVAGSVEVGAGFIDYVASTGANYARSESCPNLPTRGTSYEQCRDPRAFRLAMR